MPIKMKEATRQLALDVMTNAIETNAIGYWTVNSDWTRDEEEHMITQVTLEVQDETGYPVQPRQVYTITPEKVIAAMERIAVEKLVGPNMHKIITGMWATDDYLAGVGGDSETDDVIMQVAVLGEVRFG